MHSITRRTLMATAAGGAFLGALPVSAQSRKFFDGPSLHQLARAKGMGFGTCLGTKTGPHASPLEGSHANSFESADVRALAAAECGLLVPENELKWYVVRPDANSFDFERADRLMAYAAQSHLAVRGHTLLWNFPKWMQEWEKAYDFGPHPATEAERVLRQHIGRVCGRYGSRIFSYDVINETIDPATGRLRDTGFTRALGDNLFDIAFHATRDAAPHAELVYNDYMSWTEGNDKHYAGVLRVLEYMRKKNIPIDALGIQSHIGTGTQGDGGFLRPNEKAWRGFLDSVTGMGVGLIVTELDVEDKLAPGDVAARDKAVADYTRGYLDVILSYPQTRYVMAWGLVDSYSWLRNYSPRTDGQPKRPCPYDDDLKPKPLRAAIAAAFQSAPLRPAVHFG